MEDNLKIKKEEAEKAFSFLQNYYAKDNYYFLTKITPKERQHEKVKRELKYKLEDIGENTKPVEYPEQPESWSYYTDFGIIEEAKGYGMLSDEPTEEIFIDKKNDGGMLEKKQEWLFIGQYPNAVIYADKTINGEESGDYHIIAKVIHKPLEIIIVDKSPKYAEAIEMAKKEFYKRDAQFENLDIPEDTKDTDQSPMFKYKGYTIVRDIYSATQGTFVIYEGKDPIKRYDLENRNRYNETSIRYFLNDGEIRGIVDRNINGNKGYEDGGIINTNEITPDPSNEMEDVSLQNPDIGSPAYIPKSLVCETIDTVAPLSMLYEMNKSLTEIDLAVRENGYRGIDGFVMEKLGYDNLIDMCRAYSSEQVDAIANAIFQIERGQALILGDLTGVGKGRVCAGIIRYAQRIGKLPIFFTEKSNLFTDIFRDLVAIGSDDGIPLKFKGKDVERVRKITVNLIKEAIVEDIENGNFELDGYNTAKLFTKGYEKESKECIEEYRELYFQSELVKESSYSPNENYKATIKNAKRIVPFIVNGRSSKTEIKDSDGNILYEGLSNSKPSYNLKSAFQSMQLPDGYGVVLLTYSQVNSPTRAKEKIEWLISVANDSIVIMDESHNASGTSNTGKFLQDLLMRTAGVLYSSATFAKRPDNMPIYAMKTAIQDAEMETDTLIAAILAGGVALQEILSGDLTSEGQMLRRERSYEGVVVNYNYLDERMMERDVPLPQFNMKESHEAISDTVTSIIRKIILFQRDKVNPIIEKLDEHFKDQQVQIGASEKGSEGGINNPPIFSGIFNLINQLLFSIKAEAVAEFAILRMKEGKKVIIGFGNTLESFLDYLLKGDDDKIKTDFSVILRRRLEKTLEYTKKYPNGNSEKASLDPSQYRTLIMDYESIINDINEATTGITISPIDIVVKKIKDAGFTIAEVTGRKKYVEFNQDGIHGVIKSRRRETANELFRKFNDNEIDCLLINQSGATGASAQAIKTKKAYIVNKDANGNYIIPTSLENKNEVKQRCMIILQAELDINKEVQKRGRINRTGQVFKPIYDYVISAIPAEERLMMMLQKKLKSLDANTTSNQKQSKKLLDVVDFLNIYGDKMVVEFLSANPEYNDMIGNILKFVMGKPSEDTEPIEDKAHKVSGRVAILPVELQSNFYKTVSQNYVNLETQLRQSGEWNLEVERMDLNAKTQSKDIVSVGNPDKKSVFAEAVFIERVAVDNLRKPYKKVEVQNFIARALRYTDHAGEVIKFSPESRTDFYTKKFMDSIEFRRSNSLKDAEDRKERDLKAIKESPAYINREEPEQKIYLKEKTDKITEDYELKINSIEAGVRQLKNLIVGHLEYFTAKKMIAYPLAKYDVDGEYVKAICLGVNIDLMAQNPFAPSAMSVGFLLPNGMRLIRLALNDGLISKIKSATDNNSYQIGDRERDTDAFIEDWDDITKENRADRVIRYIVTGNILKGYGNADFRVGGKLISYTVEGGGVKKGILLPDNYDDKDIKVKVPINKAVNYLKGIANGTSVELAGEFVHIQKRNEYYSMFVKKSKNSYSGIAFDPEINSFAWADKWDFSKGEYTNKFDQATLKKLTDILWSKYKLNISITPSAFEYIKDQFDVGEREHSTTDSTDELVKRHNKLLEDYERSKAVVHVTEEELESMDALERKQVELKRDIASLEATKRLYQITSMLDEDVKKRNREEQQRKDDEKNNGNKLEKGGVIDKDDFLARERKELTDAIKDHNPESSEESLINLKNKLKTFDKLTEVIPHKTNKEGDRIFNFENGGVIGKLQKKLDDHKELCRALYPNGGEMMLENGLYGINVNGRLRNGLYIGNEYYEIDGVVYKENSKTSKPSKTSLNIYNNGGKLNPDYFAGMSENMFEPEPNKDTVDEIVEIFKKDGIYIFQRYTDERIYRVTDKLTEQNIPYGETSQLGMDLVLYDPNRRDSNLRYTSKDKIRPSDDVNSFRKLSSKSVNYIGARVKWVTPIETKYGVIEEFNHSVNGNTPFYVVKFKDTRETRKFGKVDHKLTDYTIRDIDELFLVEEDNFKNGGEVETGNKEAVTNDERMKVYHALVREGGKGIHENRYYTRYGFNVMEKVTHPYFFIEGHPELNFGSRKEVNDWFDNKGYNQFKHGGVIENYKSELEAMNDSQLAKEFSDISGIDEADILIELKDNDEEREDIISNLIERYKTMLISRGEKFKDGGTLKGNWRVYYMDNDGKKQIIKSNLGYNNAVTLSQHENTVNPQRGGTNYESYKDGGAVGEKIEIFLKETRNHIDDHYSENDKPKYKKGEKVFTSFNGIAFEGTIDGVRLEDKQVSNPPKEKDWGYKWIYTFSDTPSRVHVSSFYEDEIYSSMQDMENNVRHYTTTLEVEDESEYKNGGEFSIKKDKEKWIGEKEAKIKDLESLIVLCGESVAESKEEWEKKEFRQLIENYEKEIKEHKQTIESIKGIEETDKDTDYSGTKLEYAKGGKVADEKVIVFTQAEDKVYGEAMGYYLNKGMSNSKAEKATIEDLKKEFSRLKELMVGKYKISLDVAEFKEGGGIVNLEKELHKLQRDLNSSRLQTYIEGDNSEGAMALKKEREVKLARFNEVLQLLRAKDEYKKGGAIKDPQTINDIRETDSFAYARGEKELNEIFNEYNKNFISNTDMSGKPYSESIGGAFTLYNNDGTKVESVYVFEGDGNIAKETDRPVYQIYPTDEYFS